MSSLPEYPHDDDPVSALYVHMPFADGAYSADAIGFLSAAVADELATLDSAVSPEMISWGGGDVMQLGDSASRRLSDACLRLVREDGLIEWSVELNADTAEPDLLQLLSTAGVGRFVVRGNLTAPATEQVIRSIQMLREVGASNVAIDLAVPASSAVGDESIRLLDAIVQHEVEHVALYEGSEALPEEQFIEFYETADVLLEEAGFTRYELWSYAKPACESRYLIHCWRGDQYLGAGPGAASCVGLTRWRNLDATQKYLKSMSETKAPAREVERSTFADKVKEMIRLGLQLTDGVNPIGAYEELSTRFPDLGKNYSVESEHWTAVMSPLHELEFDGYVICKEGRFCLTTKGRFQADAVMARFL